MNCEHENFNAYAQVSRITREPEPDKVVGYVCELKVSCRDCGQSFEFWNVPHGMSFYQPTRSIDGQTINLPMVIPGTEPPEGLAGFRVTHTDFREVKQ